VAASWSTECSEVFLDWGTHDWSLSSSDDTFKSERSSGDLLSFPLTAVNGKTIACQVPSLYHLEKKTLISAAISDNIGASFCRIPLCSWCNHVVTVVLYLLFHLLLEIYFLIFHASVTIWPRYEKYPYSIWCFWVSGINFFFQCLLSVTKTQRQNLSIKYPSPAAFPPGIEDIWHVYLSLWQPVSTWPLVIPIYQINVLSSSLISELRDGVLNRFLRTIEGAKKRTMTIWLRPVWKS